MAPFVFSAHYSQPEHVDSHLADDVASCDAIVHVHLEKGRPREEAVYDTLYPSEDQSRHDAFLEGLFSLHSSRDRLLIVKGKEMITVQYSNEEAEYRVTSVTAK